MGGLVDDMVFLRFASMSLEAAGMALMTVSRLGDPPCSWSSLDPCQRNLSERFGPHAIKLRAAFRVPPSEMHFATDS